MVKRIFVFSVAQSTRGMSHTNTAWTSTRDFPEMMCTVVSIHHLMCSVRQKADDLM